MQNMLTAVRISRNSPRLKPRPHQQQCRSNIVECYNVECCFDIVASVDRPLGRRAVRFLPPFLCVSAFRTTSQKMMQLGSPNLTYKCSTMSCGNPFVLESTGQRSKSRVTKKIPFRRRSLHSCECKFSS